MPAPASLAFLLFPLLLPVLWVVITFALSFGGWQQLAARYRVPTLPAAADVSLLGYAKVGWVSYKNALRAGACHEGLALTVFFLFRPFHPPLLIPWQAVGSVESTTFLWTTTYSVTLSTGDGTGEVLKFTSSAFLATLRPWVRVLPTAP